MDNKPLSVLYINHYGVLGGAQRSLLELIMSFPENEVKPHVLTPPGKMEEYLKKTGIGYSVVRGGISKFDHTRLGYYRGLRWMILAREFVYLFPTAIALYRLRKHAANFDLIHINEITCLVPAWLVKKWYKKPVVMHARVVLNTTNGKRRRRFVHAVLNNNCDHIIAIDQHVAHSLALKNKLSIVHNSFSPFGALSKGRDSINAALGALPKRRLNVGFIGAIHRNKGIFDLAKAAKHCKQHGLDVNFVIIGNAEQKNSGWLKNFLVNAGISQDQNSALRQYIRKNDLDEHMHLLGITANTADFFRYVDVICFPSHYGALGRPVFEAAYFRRPSIVALDETFDDTFIEGETGLRFKPRDADALFEAIRFFYEHSQSLEEMGEKAYHLAHRNFDGATNAARVLSIYRSLIHREVARSPHVHSRT